MNPRFQYIRNPDEIYARSFAAIDDAADLSTLPSDIAPVAKRVIHACGMPDVLPKMRYHESFVESATQALNSACTVYCDCEMVMHGVIQKILPPHVLLTCTLNNEQTPALAKQQNTTRSAAALELWESLDGAVVLIGNAPTALFRLLEKILDEYAKPAAVIAIPVGFVGAAESKQALIEHASHIPYFTVTGTQGGSAMAAAALNAITATR